MSKWPEFHRAVLLLTLVGLVGAEISGQTVEDGIRAYRASRFAEAAQVLDRYKDRSDHPVALYYLGMMYKYGRGVSRDPILAYVLLSRSAAVRHAERSAALTELDTLENSLTAEELELAQRRASSTELPKRPVTGEERQFCADLMRIARKVSQEPLDRDLEGTPIVPNVTITFGRTQGVVIQDGLAAQYKIIFEGADRPVLDLWSHCVSMEWSNEPKISCPDGNPKRCTLSFGPTEVEIDVNRRDNGHAVQGRIIRNAATISLWRLQ